MQVTKKNLIMKGIENMNFGKMKSCIESINYYLNTEEDIPEEIKKKEIDSKLNKLMELIEADELEYKEKRDLAWKLANMM